MFWLLCVEPPAFWNEDTIKLCLYLYLGLLPVNHTLIHEYVIWRHDVMLHFDVQMINAITYTELNYRYLVILRVFD